MNDSPLSEPQPVVDAALPAATPAVAGPVRDWAALQERLTTWRARGFGAQNPLDAAFIDALARRAESLSGPLQERVRARLTELLDAREARATAPAPQMAEASAARSHASTAPRTARVSALAELVAQLARQSVPPPSADRPTATDEALASLGGPPDLKAMGYFRSTWSRLSAERRLTQSLARVPDKAGPLNTQHLVHQTLTLMRELSPAYLQHFVDYADTLMWLERAQSPRADEAAPSRGAAAKAKGPAARKAAKPRTRAR